MIGRKLLYGYVFTLALASVALEAEAERARNAGETGADVAAKDPYQPRREEIFRYVEEGALAKAEAKADELLLETRRKGTNADQIDALSIRGRVANAPEARQAFYEEALQLARANVFARSHHEYVSYLSLSHVQQDLGDVAMEADDKATALRHYQAALDSLSAFDLQTYLSYAVSPDARYSPSANELRYIVGWLNLREGKMDEAESAFRFAEKGMLAAGGKVEDSVHIGLAVAARYRGDQASAEARMKEVEKRQGAGRGLASIGSASPSASAMIKRARTYLKTGNVTDLHW